MPHLPADRARRDAGNRSPTPGAARKGQAGAGLIGNRSLTVAALIERRAVGAREIAAAAGPYPLVLTRRIGAARILQHVCPLAAECGLRPGMTLAQARAMAPELRAIEHEPRADREALEQLAHWALRFSPSVQPLEPDTLWLDVTGCERLFRGEDAIVRQARRGLRSLGFTARAAIADTPAAAYALACAGGDSETVCPPGQSCSRLAPLPTAALRIDPRVEQQLYALGVRTIGDLMMLPRASLPARFGPMLVRRLEQALGEVIEPLDTLRAERPPEARAAFDGPLNDVQTLQIVARRLLDELFEQLVARELALRGLDCILIHEHRAPATLEIGLSRPSRASAHIAELLAGRLERVKLGEGVVSLLLVARQTSRWHAAQAELFEPHDPARDEALDVLLDRFANRLGRDAIVQAELVDDYQPEAALRFVSMCDTSERGAQVHGVSGEERRSSATAAACSSMQPRPTRLLDRPLPIRAVALSPDGPPTWVSIRGTGHVVARAWGPERIETGWWRGPDVRRDYFRVLTESGELLWVFRDRVSATWNLHGVFC